MEATFLGMNRELLIGVGGIVGTIALIILPITLVVVVQVYLFGRCKVKQTGRELGRVSFEPNEWAEKHGFRFAGVYGVLGINFAAWYNGEISTFLIQYLLPRSQFEFDTGFEDEFDLETATTVDGCMLPQQPGNYCQIFPGVTLDELWHRHVDSGRFLVAEGVQSVPFHPDVPWPPQNREEMESWARERDREFARDDGNPYAHRESEHESPLQAAEREMICTLLEKSLRRQSRYLRSLTCWYLRWPYWYFVRRMRMPRQNVEQLIANGWYDLPRIIQEKRYETAAREF